MDRPHLFDPSEPDDLYGSVDELLESYHEGAERLAYRIKGRLADQWLSRYTGSSGGEPQDPQALPTIDDELRLAVTPGSS